MCAHLPEAKVNGEPRLAGEVHQRHRKIMNPAFSAPQLRSFLTLFQDIGLKVGIVPWTIMRPAHMPSSQMCEKWKNEVLDSSGKTVYVNRWLARTTLDIIGAGRASTGLLVAIR